MSTKLKDYDYHLPENLIGQEPREPRDHAKLMVIDKDRNSVEDRRFYNIIDYLKEGDLLVRNSTRVIPARLVGKKETGAILEVFLLKRIDLNTWECMMGNAKKLKLGQKVLIGENSELVGTLVEIREDGNRVVEFSYEGAFEEVLDKLGEMPLPPYITKSLKERDRYQTVYAKKGESVAAPTAGLHFTKELLGKIEEKGIEIVDVYLKVGLGTFRPVKEEDVLNHNMHSETYEVPREAKEKIEKAKKEGRRVIAIGTTSVRTLEAASTSSDNICEGHGETDIFIYPGYEFKVVDGMITNFHLPKSTLLMLVSAFYNREKVLDIYKEAVEKEYHFFSFGDSMFIY